MRDESEQAVLHRLEAFSDIVIGFSLAQVGLSLTIPQHISDIFGHVKGISGLFALVITFTLVCSLWWLHHKLFRHLFVPTARNVAINFAALGGILFYAYVMQVLIHVTFSDPYAFPLYFGCYAYIALLFAYLAWYGLRARGATFPAPVREEQRDLAVRLTILAVGFTAVTVLALIAGSNLGVLRFAAFLVVIPLLIQRLLIRRRKARAAALSSPSA
jgi:uncharacterized membrane protein